MSDPQTSTEGNQTEENKTIIYVWKIPLDKVFVMSINSIFMIVATVLSLIAFICVASGRTLSCDASYSSSYSYFEFVSMSSFWILLTSWLFYALTLTQRMFLRRIPWLFVDLIYNAIYIVFYFIANIVVAAQSCGKDNNKAGSAFGFMAMLCMVAKPSSRCGYFEVNRPRLARSRMKTNPQNSLKNSTEFGSFLHVQ